MENYLVKSNFAEKCKGRGPGAPKDRYEHLQKTVCLLRTKYTTVR